MRHWRSSRTYELTLMAIATPEYSPNVEPSGLLLPPLLTALSIIVGMFLTLLALHFLLKRLHARDPATPTASRASRARGVDSKVLDSFPVHSYSKGHELLQPGHQSECCVCLSALEEGAPVRILQSCRHVFHCRCIDAWFASHSSCPFCRAEVTVAAAAESFVVHVDAIGDGSDGSPARDCCPAFREKLSLKRCSSLESCNVGSTQM